MQAKPSAESKSAELLTWMKCWRMGNDLGGDRFTTRGKTAWWYLITSTWRTSVQSGKRSPSLPLGTGMFAITINIFLFLQCSLVLFRCGPHLHWAPHIEDKRHPRKVTEWPRRKVEQHPLAHGAHDTQQEYHMWVNSTFTRIRTQSNAQRAWREFYFHDQSSVRWVSLSWPSTHPEEMGQVILYAQVSTLSAK